MVRETFVDHQNYLMLNVFKIMACSIYYNLETHVLMENGAICSESGLKIVDTQEECRNVKQFVQNYYPNTDATLSEIRESNYPKGCFVSTIPSTGWSGMFFNTNEYGDSEEKSRQVCKSNEVSKGIIYNIYNFS